MSLQNVAVERHALVWAFTAQGVCIIPLLVYLPVWLPAMWLGVMLWRIQIYRGAWPFPKTYLKFILAGLCVAGLLASFAGISGVEPLIAFLVVSFVLKLVEMRKRSDVLLVLFTGFFAVASQFLFYQNIVISIYALLCCAILIAAWIAIYSSRIISVKQLIRYSGTVLLHSLPLMLIFFLVLPRFGAFWQVPLSQKGMGTGFSDSMSPGSISELTRSSDPAFRVNFLGGEESERILPQPNQRYWRGLVLDEFDGRNWHYSRSWYLRNGARFKGAPESWRLQNSRENLLRYEILIEPHQQRWLFTLMAPTQIDSSNMEARFGHDYLALADKPVSSRIKYTVESDLDYLASPDSLPLDIYRRNLHVPEGYNPKAVALARSWLADGHRGQDIVNKALFLFQDSFYYTLRPPILGRHSIDEFLFLTQRGFCEHFASSFVILMRSANIPARVVVGYQGGEYNPLEDYFLVRQSDAHAWAEVWFDGKGWVRVDPTAAVAPSRIEEGLSASLEGEERALLGAGFEGAWYSPIQMRLDAMSYSWHKWVLGYDDERRKEVLKKLLGGGELWRIALFFVGTFVSVLLVIFIWLVVRHGAKPKPAEVKVYRMLLAKLERRGYSLEPGETPGEFIQRVANDRPKWCSQLSLIHRLFNRVVYEQKLQDLPKLRRFVQQLSLE